MYCRCFSYLFLSPLSLITAVGIQQLIANAIIMKITTPAITCNGRVGMASAGSSMGMSDNAPAGAKYLPLTMNTAINDVKTIGAQM